MNHWTNRIGIVIGGLSLFALGCQQPETGESAPGEETAALEDGTAAPQDASDSHDCDEKHGKLGKRGKGGPGGMLLHQALEHLELSEAQRKTLESLAEPGEKSEAGRTAHKAFRDTLAEGVRAGRLDDAAINGHLAALEELGNAKRDVMLEKLNTLHATLTPDQRIALVDGMTAKAAAREARHEGDDGHAKKGRTRMGKKGKKGKRGMMAMVRGLDLSEEQRTELRDAMGSHEKPSPEAMKEKFAAKREKMKSMMAAFAGNDFDAQAMVADDPKSGKMRKMIERKVTMVRTLIGILDEGQREQLAANLEKDWKAGKRDKRGKFGKRGERGERGERRTRGLRAPRDRGVDVQ